MNLHPQAQQKIRNFLLQNVKSHQNTKMEQPKTQSSLFEVYLRLRPPPTTNALYPTLATGERFITVEEAASENALPTYITLNPPNDNRRRAVEKFAFTEVFEESASQLDIFEGTGVLPLVEGVLGPEGGEGRDGLLATLGVTGSGKVCDKNFFSS
jgi:transcriptional accessory protein Tex/SPT6